MSDGDLTITVIEPDGTVSREDVLPYDELVERHEARTCDHLCPLCYAEAMEHA